MNYFTFKKVAAYSMVSVFALSASAQNATTSTPAKTFGGTGQYRTWSIGLNAGVTSPTLVIGGTNDASPDVSLGYGISLRKQINHQFGIVADLFQGKVQGHASPSDIGAGTYVAGGDDNAKYGLSRFRTSIHHAASLSAQYAFGSVDFLNRDNSLNFFVKAGIGTTAYSVFKSTVIVAGKPVPKDRFKNGSNMEASAIGNRPTYSNLFVPVGLGAAYKLSDKFALNFGYTMNFLDDDLLDGLAAKGSSEDKWSYGYVGINYSIGDASKPNLDWANPVAMMYDELKDPTLRQELEALKGRVSTLESTVSQLSADADGDGVSNKFDKCAGTPAGTQVDGAGCPIKFPAPVETVSAPSINFAPIQFEFDSSVLKTSSYPILDQLSAALRGNSTTISLEGYASAEGTDEYNLRLSTDRANSVKTYLVNSGVDASKITVKGLGEANPIASNSTEEGRIQNRRVEIKK